VKIIFVYIKAQMADKANQHVNRFREMFKNKMPGHFFVKPPPTSVSLPPTKSLVGDFIKREAQLGQRGGKIKPLSQEELNKRLAFQAAETAKMKERAEAFRAKRTAQQQQGKPTVA
jgi:hypothetical protein